MFRKKASFVLPPPKALSDNQYEPAKLTIQVQLDNWRLSRINRFIYLLTELENHLPFTDDQRVNLIERGSLIIQLLGLAKNLFSGLRMLVDLQKTKVEINNQSIETEIKKVDLEKAKIDLEFHRKSKEMEAEMMALEVQERKLKFLEHLEERFDFDYKSYVSTEEGRQAQTIAGQIQKEFPVLSLKLEEKIS